MAVNENRDVLRVTRVDPVGAAAVRTPTIIFEQMQLELGDGHILRFDTVSGEYQVLSNGEWLTLGTKANMRWKGVWIDGPEYQKHDVVRDDYSWLMIANKTTTDKPAPVPVGTPEYTANDVPDAGIFDASTITSGQRYTLLENRYIDAIKVFANEVVGYTFRIEFRVWTDAISDGYVLIMDNVALMADVETVISISPIFAVAGQTVEVLIVALNSGGTTEIGYKNAFWSGNVPAWCGVVTAYLYFNDVLQTGYEDGLFGIDFRSSELSFSEDWDIVDPGGTAYNGAGGGGSFNPAEYQADSVATSVGALKKDFNSLLAKMQAAGLMQTL